MMVWQNTAVFGAKGVIADLTETNIISIFYLADRRGSIGGKARGLAFLTIF